MGKTRLACVLPLACARAGLVHVPINPVLKRAQAAHILADSGARLLIANQARLATLGAASADARPIALEDWQTGDEALPPSSADPDDLAALLYTSGSTGLPKGVMLSHANLWLGAVSVAHYPRAVGRATARWRCCRWPSIMARTSCFRPGRRAAARSPSTICCRATWSARSDVMTSPCSPACRRCGSSSPRQTGRAARAGASAR